MASRMFATASSRVLPWETQPGKTGHSATNTPSSSGAIKTRNFMASRWPFGSPSATPKAMPAHDIIDNRKEKLDTRVARAVRRDRGRRSQSDDQLARKSLSRTDHPGRESRGDV